MSCQDRVFKDEIATEHFFKSAEISSFLISPDGKSVSFLRSSPTGEKNLFIRSVANNKEIKLTTFKGKSIRDYCWAGNKYFCLIVENIGANTFEMYTLHSDGSHLKEINLNSNITKIDFVRRNKGIDISSVLFSVNSSDQERIDVYELNLQTRTKKKVSTPDNFIEGFADENNVLRLAKGNDGTNENWYYRESNTNGFKKVISNHFTSNMQPVFFVRGKKHNIYALSNISRDKYALVEIDCKSGKEIRTIYENTDADILNVVYSARKNKVVYVNTGLHKGIFHFLDQEVKSDHQYLSQKMGTRNFDVVDYDVKEKHVILKAYSDKYPGAFYLYDADKKELTALGEVNSRIDSSRMHAMHPVVYKNREGITIHAYLTLPKKSNRKFFPLLVIPHSSVYQRVNWGYDPEVQFFVNRGYAVFQPNYRGSSGYGKDFFKAAFKEWNGNVQNDIEDGVNWLIEQKKIDSARIAIYGRGFAGLTAINLGIKRPDTYKCIVSYSGILNLFTYIKSTPNYYKSQRHVIEELLGNPEKDIEYIKAVSPIFHIDKLKNPVFLFQGGRDARVNAVETNQFLRELRKYNDKIGYMQKEDESYKIVKLENKVEFYNAVERFLKEHLK